MHVGPGDPVFGPGRMGGGVGAPPGHGLPPGARWDPIAPPGMRGFHPGAGARACGGGRRLRMLGLLAATCCRLPALRVAA